MKYSLIFILLLIIVTNDEAFSAAPSFKFAIEYRVEEIMNDPSKAEDFVSDYLTWEGEFFSIARDEKTALTYDGYYLDENTGLPSKTKCLSAPSKECLDMAICIKTLEGDPLASIMVAKGDEKKAVSLAFDILKTKLDSYLYYYNKYPGYGGFMPWYSLEEDITPTHDWMNYVPGLDNGEWLWTLLVAERVLREKGYIELADRYAGFIEMLRLNVVKIFYDEKAGKVRADVHILDMYSRDSLYETAPESSGHCPYLTGEHGVHEGVMMVLFVTLFGNGLPEDARERIWKDIKMERVEHKYGTTWKGYWGSAHESWAYLFIPLRDIPGYRNIFRIREIIRSQNAVERGYPGFSASINKPGEDAYISAAGIEGVGSQDVPNNNIFAIYGVFPVLLQFSDNLYKDNYGLAWLLNMLKARKMQGPLGGGEAGTNDGRYVSYVKTIDGSFPNIIALMGGLEKETAGMLRDYDLYDDFIDIMEKEYEETFGEEPLREPAGFVIPFVSIPVDKMSDYQ